MAANTINEFNLVIKNYRNDENIHDQLNRYISILIACPKWVHLEVVNVNAITFYYNLQRLMDDLDPKCVLMWSCITLLEKAIRISETRNLLVKDIKFVPTLANILSLKLATATSQNKKIRLYTLLQNLTYGINIKCNEPYLLCLIQALVKNINEQEDENICTLALSILVNICYKNLPSIVLFTRNIHIVTFMKQIQSYGFLAYKMCFIMANHTTTDYRNFLNGAFMELEKSIINWNAFNLQHILDFLIDANNCRATKIIIEEFDFRPYVINLIQVISNSRDNEDIHLLKTECIGVIFGLLSLLISSENTSMREIYADIFDFSLNFIQNAHITHKIIDTMQHMVSDGFEINFDMIKPILSDMILQFKNNLLDVSKLISLLKLLVVLCKPFTEIKSFITDDFFTYIFKPIKDSDIELHFNTTISKDQLLMYLLGVKVLIKFATNCNEILLLKITEIFKLKQLHHVFANAILSKDSDVLNLVLELVKSEHFPSQSISNIIAERKADPEKNEFQVETYRQVKKIRDFYILNKPLEDRMNVLIDYITQAKNNNVLNNVATSDIIELYEYQISNFNKREKEMEHNLNTAFTENTRISQRNAVLTSENTMKATMIYDLHFAQERLKSLNSLLEEESAKIQQTLKMHETRYESFVKTSEKLEKSVMKYKEMYESVKDEAARCEKAADQKIADMGKQIKEMTKKQSELMKSIQNLQEINGSQLELIKENEKKTTKFLEEKNKLKYELIEKESLIKHLETTIQQKEEEIRRYETELEDTEDLRNTVITLMQKKKAKKG